MKNLKPFFVEYTFNAVIMAENMRHAQGVAHMASHDALRDGPLNIHVIEELQCLEDLSEGWDGDCIPYEGDGSTKLKDILK